MISASQANAYRRCPQAWYYRYREGRKIAPAWAIKGRGQHRALEAHFTRKIETHADEPVALMLDTFRSEVAAALQSSEEEVILFAGESEARIVDDGVAGLQSYHASIAPVVQPVMVEARVEATLPSGLQVIGVLDCVDAGLAIRDAKFPTDPMREDELIYETQPPLYAWLYHALTEEWPSRVAFDVVSLGRGKTPNPRAVTHDIAVTPAQVTDTLRDLESVAASIEAGIVYRRPSAFNCAKCGYRTLCWNRMGQPS